MANLGGKLMFGVALEPQCRLFFIPWVRRNSLVNCLKGRDYGTTFQMAFNDEGNGFDQSLETMEFSDGVNNVLGRTYIRKKSGSDTEIQNSSRVIYDFEDKNKFGNSLDCGKVVGKDYIYITDKFVKVEKSQTSSPRMDESDDKDKYNLGCYVATVESSNGEKILERSYICNEFVKTEKAQTFSPSRNNFEDNDDEDDLEPDSAMVESLIGGKVLGRRYIPKKSVETENVQTSYQPINFADKVERNSAESNKVKERYLDGEMNSVRNYVSGKKLNQKTTPKNNLIFDNGPEDEKIDHTWESNDSEDGEKFTDDLQEKDPMQNRAYQSAKTRLDVEKKAITLLGTRAFTTVELRKKMLAKQFPLQIVNEVIADFQNRGFLNDCLYAESFSRSRFSSSSWGPRRIQQALLRKGVSEADTKKALKVIFKDNVSSEDQELRLGLSKLSLDHLYVQASKQWLQNQVIPSDKRKSKLVQWLQYRGFNWGVIKFVLKKLESEYPP